MGIPAYTFFAGVGSVAAYACFIYLQVLNDADIRKNTFACCAGLLGLAIGARALGILSYHIAAINAGRAIPPEDILRGGLVFYGGLYGFLLVYRITVRFQKRELQESLDTVTVCIPLFHSIARVGCYYAGCCYGIQTEAGRRIPVSLIEAGFNVMIFVLLYMLLIKNIAKNHLIMVYLLVYSLIRFCLEFLRGDQARGFIGFLSVSQVISALTLIMIVTYIIKVNQ